MSELDYSKITDLSFDGVDRRDYPDFCDAYISSGLYKNELLTDEQIEALNDNSNFVHEQLWSSLY